MEAHLLTAGREAWAAAVAYSENADDGGAAAKDGPASFAVECENYAFAAASAAAEQESL